MNTNPHDESPIDVLVVGAGLAGLAAAATAAGDRRRVVLLDTRSAGGRARTDERQGFRFNQGPHALYRGGPGRQVLGRLGIDPTGEPPLTDQSYALRDGRLFVLPTNARSMMMTGLLSTRSKIQASALLARIGHIDPTPLAGLSVNQWLDSLGLRPDVRGLIETVTRVATFAADLNLCSADAGVRQLQMAIVEGVDYLHGGWQQIVDAMVAAATERGVEIRTDERVLGLRPADDAVGWTVTTPAGELSVASVVLAPGSPAATVQLLGERPDWDLGADITAACLDLGLRQVPPHPIVFGVGQPWYLSTHSPPADLAPDGQVVVHVMRYGARTAEVDRPELWELAATAGITEADVVTDRFLHSMTVAHAVPRPGRGWPVGRRSRWPGTPMCSWPATGSARSGS